MNPVLSGQKPTAFVIDPDIEADAAKFERMLAQYLAGDLDEDVFRVFRLANGIYGQRQGGHNQMVRVKIPYGSISAEQLDAFVATLCRRGKARLALTAEIRDDEGRVAVAFTGSYVAFFER